MPACAAPSTSLWLLASSTSDHQGCAIGTRSWLLLKEDGSESQYRVPSERESEAIKLPATFFLNGWHLVLTPGEIAMLLAIMDMARSVGRPSEPDTQQWVALPQSTRRDLYGLTGEIYLHAQQLREFGLVYFHDPMPTRRRGKISTKRMPPPATRGRQHSRRGTGGAQASFAGALPVQPSRPGNFRPERLHGRTHNTQRAADPVPPGRHRGANFAARLGQVLPSGEAITSVAVSYHDTGAGSSIRALNLGCRRTVAAPCSWSEYRFDNARRAGEDFVSRPWPHRPEEK